MANVQVAATEPCSISRPSDSHFPIVSLEADDLSLRLDRNTNRLYQEINELVTIFRCEIDSFTM